MVKQFRFWLIQSLTLDQDQLNELIKRVLLGSTVCRSPTTKAFLHLWMIITMTQSLWWSGEERTICGILAESGFVPVPWNPHTAGLLFVAGSGFSEWHSSHCTGHRDRGGWPEKILGGGKQWLKAAHKCLLFSFGPLTLCLPAKQDPVRPAPLSNSLISRKNNNVGACFDWDKNKKRPKSCSLRLSLSRDNRALTFLFNVVQIKQHSYTVPWGAWRPTDGAARGELSALIMWDSKGRFLINYCALLPLTRYLSLLVSVWEYFFERFLWIYSSKSPETWTENLPDSRGVNPLPKAVWLKALLRTQYDFHFSW